jgi:hypothetical protein
MRALRRERGVRLKVYESLKLINLLCDARWVQTSQDHVRLRSRFDQMCIVRLMMAQNMLPGPWNHTLLYAKQEIYSDDEISNKLSNNNNVTAAKGFATHILTGIHTHSHAHTHTHARVRGEKLLTVKSRLGLR